MALYREDKSAGFIGLIGGGLLVLALLYGIVQWTNAKFAGHGARPAAGATH